MSSEVRGLVSPADGECLLPESGNLRKQSIIVPLRHITPKQTPYYRLYSTCKPMKMHYIDIVTPVRDQANML
jgi:hypothetical protein